MNQVTTFQQILAVKCPEGSMAKEQHLRGILRWLSSQPEVRCRIFFSVSPPRCVAFYGH